MRSLKKSEYFARSSEMPMYPKTGAQGYLDKVTRLWNFGLLLQEIGRYEKARKNFQKAVEDLGTALRVD
jgi:tetratricopeptide (TPR) repeat protein